MATPRVRVRNRTQEELEARGQLALRAADIRVARDADELAVTQIAQAIVLCGLPYVPTAETRITRRARLADGSEVRVTFSAGLDSEMPYGSDRTLLYFLLDRAVKTGNRFVSWRSATAYLDQMGMSVVSGKNYADLRKRFERLRGLTIGVQRTNNVGDSSTLLPVIRRAVLPPSMTTGQAVPDAAVFSTTVEYGVEIDEHFFDDLLRFHVPVPTELLAKTRKQSQLQDICLFLHWRCYAAGSESVIPWDKIRDQMWHDDTNTRRVKQRFAEAIRFLRVIWPELEATAGTEGLTVAPPKNRVYLLPKGKEAKRNR